MIIFNPRLKKDQKIENLKTVTYPQLNKAGEMVDMKCIEFTVIGNNGKWQDWLFYGELINANPGMENVIL